ARVAGLVGTAATGVIIAGNLTSDNFAADRQSVRAFHEAVIICAVLVATGGLAGLVGITNARRTVAAAGCSGRHLAGAPEAAAESGWRGGAPAGAPSRGKAAVRLRPLDHAGVVAGRVTEAGVDAVRLLGRLLRELDAASLELLVRLPAVVRREEQPA